jgi:hypothetical protein
MSESMVGKTRALFAGITPKHLVRSSNAQELLDRAILAVLLGEEIDVVAQIEEKLASGAYRGMYDAAAAAAAAILIGRDGSDAARAAIAGVDLSPERPGYVIALDFLAACALFLDDTGLAQDLHEQRFVTPPGTDLPAFRSEIVYQTDSSSSEEDLESLTLASVRPIIDATAASPVTSSAPMILLLDGRARAQGKRAIDLLRGAAMRYDAAVYREDGELRLVIDFEQIDAMQEPLGIFVKATLTGDADLVPGAHPFKPLTWDAASVFGETIEELCGAGDAPAFDVEIDARDGARVSDASLNALANRVAVAMHHVTLSLDLECTPNVTVRLANPTR